MKETSKEYLVEAIQLGLWNSQQNKIDRNIIFNNNAWNDNLNFIFDSVLKLNNQHNLVCFKFSRSGFELVAIFDKNTKTLFSICSENTLSRLLKQDHIDKIHYTHSFCQLSNDKNSIVQEKMFFVIEDNDTINSLNKLLDKITENFEYKNEVERYAIIETKINHKEMKLYNIRAVYLNKEYNISEIDDTWNKYIQTDYEEVFVNNGNIEAQENEEEDDNYLDNLISIKENIVLKEKNYEN